MNSVLKAPPQLAQVQTLLQQLPEGLQTDAQARLVQRIEQNDNLRVSLVGAFSVGKSSLLNMLLGDEWLHTAQEEATALPTVIEYASTPTLYWVQQDGQHQPLDREQFSQVTTQAPTGFTRTGQYLGSALSIHPNANAAVRRDCVFDCAAWAFGQ
jgi:ATPase subunit of ABC transporter with duplicated ATPase domains